MMMMMMMIGPLLLTLTMMITASSAADLYYHLVIRSEINNVNSPDCQDLTTNFKYLFLVHDALNPTADDGPSMYGPSIEADEGDTLNIQVTNLNPFMGASIHWHGIHQIETPYSDGVAGITQCQLQPLATQNYTFAAYPSGTHFWHGHFGMDEADGVTGPIIVRPKTPPPYQYDEDVVVFLQDFYGEQTAEQQQVGLDSFPFVWMVSFALLCDRVYTLLFTIPTRSHSLVIYHIHRAILIPS